jgi:hypothetical protein
VTDAKILAADLIFFGSYVVFALGKFLWMKIDRPGAAFIVVEGAAAGGVSIGFREYFRAGLPVTIATLALGSVWLLLTR